jgi:hypothetical protein
MWCVLEIVLKCGCFGWHTFVEKKTCIYGYFKWHTAVEKTTKIRLFGVAYFCKKKSTEILPFRVAYVRGEKDTVLGKNFAGRHLGTRKLRSLLKVLKVVLIELTLQLICISTARFGFKINCIKWVLLKFSIDELIWNHLLTLSITILITSLKSERLEWVKIMLVSCASIVGS